MPAPAELQLQKSAEDTLTVALTGSWKLGEALPSADEIQQKLDGKPGINKIAFDRCGSTKSREDARGS